MIFKPQTTTQLDPRILSKYGSYMANPKAQYYAQLLADNGITKEVLFKIIDKEYFDNESNKHGGKAQRFSEDFLNSIDKKSTNNHTNDSNLLQDKSKVYIVMNTSSNGMEVWELKAKKAMAKL